MILDFRFDFQRKDRIGLIEAIWGEDKSVDQLKRLSKEVLRKEEVVFITRINKEKASQLLDKYGEGKFFEEAKRLIPNKNFIGFSITAGNPYRKKEFDLKEIIKVANHYSKIFTPTFFVEKNKLDLINILKKEVNNCYIPEEEALEELKSIASKADRGDISLDDSIAEFERGALLKKHCDKILQKSSLKIEQIVKDME